MIHLATPTPSATPFAVALRSLRDTFLPEGYVIGSIALLIGAPIIGFGLLLIIQSSWGVGPWDVLHLGIARQTGLTFGRVNQLTGLVVVLFVVLLRGRTISIVTVLNVIFIGMWADLYAKWGWVPYMDDIVGMARVLLGVVVLGFGTALYLHPNKGAGPRDGLMLTLTERTGQPLYRIKIALDLAALVIGFLLGGPVGIGTVVVAFGLGPAIHTFAGLLNRLDVHDWARKRTGEQPDGSPSN